MEATTSGNSARKCPNCGKWSEWNQKPTDTCVHCGQLLNPEGYERQEKKQKIKEEEKNRLKINLITIDPNEPFYLKGPKYLVRAIQVSFVAVVSFLIWLIVAIAS